MRASFLAAIVVALAGASPSAGHDQRFRSPDLKPRIGLMSNEVALQRLRTAGIVNPRVLRREGDRLILQAVVGGEARTLHMDLSRGEVTDASNPSRVVLSVGRSDRPLVTGSQLQVDRRRLSDPALMRDTIRTPR